MAGIDAYTKFLANFDGADGDTSYTPYTAQAFTMGSGNRIESDQKVFGATSLYCGGTAAAWVADSDDWSFGSGDFTIDLRVRMRAHDGVNAQALCGQSNSTATASTRQNQIIILGSKKMQFSLWNTSATRLDSTTGATVLNIDTWYHVALVRNGNTATLYLDGTAECTLDLTGVTLQNAASIFSFGAIGDFTSNFTQAYLDEFRISKGIARWTANFTPPTSPYSLDGGFMTTNKGWL
jgi:hypothetical protein